MEYLNNRIGLYKRGLVSYDDIMGYLQCMIDNGLISNADSIRVIAMVCSFEK